MQNFFRNSAEPGGIIEFPQGLQDADFERLAERWRFQHQGVANAHRVAILERGTWKDRKLTQRDMQFEQLRRFERDQILGAFGMPLAIMGITESVNRANAEAAEVMYARWLVRPRLMRIRSALNERLLKLYPDGDNLFFDFVDPVPMNRLETIQEGQMGYSNQILTLNEARARFGADPVEDADEVPISNMAGNLQVRTRMELERQALSGYEKRVLTLNEARALFDQPPVEGGDEMAPPPSAFPMLGPAPEPDEPEEPEESDEEVAGYGPRKPRRGKVEANDDYPDNANRSANRIERGWKRRLQTELQSFVAFLEREDKSVSSSVVATHIPGQVEASDRPLRPSGAMTIEREIGEITKLTPDVTDQYDWNWWVKYGDEVVEELQESFYLVLEAAMPGASVPELQRAAATYAEARGAELLSIDMVDVSNTGRREGARMLWPSLAETTREEVRQLVSQSIKDGEPLQKLTTKLKQSGSFTTARARRIARTETATALGQGQKTVAKSEGRNEKRWVTQGDQFVNPEICAANAAQGWIAIEDAFQSGEDTIPGHVNCRCTVIYRDTPISEEVETGDVPLIQASVRCPMCNRKNGENVLVGTLIRCRRCKHEWEVHHDQSDS